MMRGFTVIDPSHSSVWICSDSSHLVKKLGTTMAEGFDPEAFKAQLKEELLAENRLIMREMMGKMAKMMKDKQPEQPTVPIDLDAEIPIKERAEDEVTVIVDPERWKNMIQAENVEESDWAKNMNKIMARMQMMMKEKGIDTLVDYADLDEGG